VGGCGLVNATRDRDEWRVLVSKKIKLQVPEYAENFNSMENCQLLKTCTAVCSLLTTHSSDGARHFISSAYQQILLQT